MDHRTAAGMPTGWRAIAALLALVASVGTALAFVGVALILATFNCEDGCAVGSRWSPGAWGSLVQLFALAIPALISACILVWAIASGRRSAAIWAWVLMTALLIAWCVFTRVTTVTIDFSSTNSHWMWLAGLLCACVGGLPGVLTTLPRLPPGATTSRS